MAIQNYDIRQPDEKGELFEDHFWNPVNRPILNIINEVEYIIHLIKDVTE